MQMSAEGGDSEHHIEFLAAEEKLNCAICECNNWCLNNN